MGPSEVATAHLHIRGVLVHADTIPVHIVGEARSTEHRARSTCGPTRCCNGSLDKLLGLMESG